MQNRIEVFRQMLEADPSNTMVMFGLAKEYEKTGQFEEVVNLLEKYLAKSTMKAMLTECWQRLMKK